MTIINYIPLLIWMLFFPLTISLGMWLEKKTELSETAKSNAAGLYMFGIVVWCIIGDEGPYTFRMHVECAFATKDWDNDDWESSIAGDLSFAEAKAIYQEHLEKEANEGAVNS
jgi:hypothetical protein